MEAILTGKFIEGGRSTNSKTGQFVPYAMIYSGKEIVKVNNSDLSGLILGNDVEIPVTIFQGKYGLYIRAVDYDD